MALRRYELEDLVTRPGTYFNPSTEVVVIVDDSTTVDNEIFNDGEFEADEWIQLSDEAPIDDVAREDLLETFHAQNSPGLTGAVPADEDDEDELDDIEPDEDEGEDEVEVLDPEEF